MFKKKKFLFGGIIILAAIVYLGYMGFNASATYYYTVSEFLAGDVPARADNIKLNGDVSPGSIEISPGGLGLSFTITEGGSSLPVYYEGVIPDAFDEGNEVVIEGSLDKSNIFQAHTILVKCPSKYEPDGGA